ncbi:DEAD/DEAH box helicase [Lutibacter sp. A64]|uniref:DEAD/DEAH box helicase n=1 Tax=Lutibacter sp. A64 TaxID=2918526 RepID=UPI001F054DD8|nr:DEAD/DEAH box helicase [Lutibacter sp. A64]UMB54652.1 DEAD/DEAH box helicase [Lutibacter sp. A64]
MPFKKLHSNIKEKLEILEITAPTPFQKVSIPAIKSGVNLFCTSPINSGKTTTLILTTLQKLKCEAVGTAPRAFIFVENRERALELYELFLTYTRHNSLRVYFVDEKLHVDVQKSDIFEGADILISTPQSMKKLFLYNGVNTTQLQLFSIDDAAFLAQKSPYTDLLQITQSISKCQFVIYSDKMHPVLKRFKSHFMEYAKTISI